MDPRRFLDLARLLKGGPATPESYRSAISRAYYAAFHVGVVSLDAIGIGLNEGPQAHGELPQCLGACQDADLDEARDHLRRLSGRRRRADYRLDDAAAETRKEADLACQEAAEAIRILDQLKRDPGKQAAILAMKQYARARTGIRVS